jgi:hypothetical protein
VKIPLSPIDNLFLGPHAYPIEMSFSFPVRLDVAHLQSALDKLCAAWPPLTGRVAMTDKEAWIEPGKSSLVIEAEESRNLPREDELKSLQAMTTGFRTDPGEPLLRIRILNSDNRSWCSVAMAHALGDGYSYFLFLRNLALVAAGESPMPVRWDRSPLTPVPAVLESTEGDLPVDIGAARSRFGQQSVTWLLQTLSKDEARARLNEAQAVASCRISLHDWICALHWQREARALVLSGAVPNQVRLATPVDFRRFRKTDLGGLFFGNAVYFATVAADLEEVVEAPLGKLAEKVRGAIKSVSLETIELQVALWRKAQDEQGLHQVQNWNLFQPGSPTLVTNLSSLPLNEIRLGKQGEAPVCVRYTAVFPGLSVVLPSAEGDVAVQCTTLSPGF